MLIKSPVQITFADYSGNIVYIHDLSKTYGMLIDQAYVVEKVNSLIIVTSTFY